VEIDGGESAGGLARPSGLPSHRPRIPPSGSTASPTSPFPHTVATGMGREQVLRAGTARATARQRAVRVGEEDRRARLVGLAGERLGVQGLRAGEIAGSW
jgi:hypothetical protein